MGYRVFERRFWGEKKWLCYGGHNLVLEVEGRRWESWPPGRVLSIEQLSGA